MQSKRVIIDCDPGADDAIALMLACHSPELEIIGVTTVAGNTTADQTARNAADILNLCNRTGIFVYRGEAQPLKRELKFGTDYCGQNGLCGIDLKESPAGWKTDAVRYLTETLSHAKEPVTIISLAPMTNLAAALMRNPDIAGNIACIITSTGYYGLQTEKDGIKPRAEWNAAVDPEAAKYILESGIDIFAVGLDVSGHLTEALAERILAVESSTAAAGFLHEAARYYERNGLCPYSLFVDSMAVAYAVEPGIAQMQKGEIHMDISAGMGAFTMKLDTHNKRNHPSSVSAAYFFDFFQFENLLKDRVL